MPDRHDTSDSENDTAGEEDVEERGNWDPNQESYLMEVCIVACISWLVINLISIISLDLEYFADTEEPASCVDEDVRHDHLYNSPKCYCPICQTSLPEPKSKDDRRVRRCPKCELYHKIFPKKMGPVIVGKDGKEHWLNTKRKAAFEREWEEWEERQRRRQEARTRKRGIKKEKPAHSGVSVRRGIIVCSDDEDDSDFEDDKGGPSKRRSAPAGRRDSTSSIKSVDGKQSARSGDDPTGSSKGKGRESVRPQDTMGTSKGTRRGSVGSQSAWPTVKLEDAPTEKSKGKQKEVIPDPTPVKIAKPPKIKITSLRDALQDEAIAGPSFAAPSPTSITPAPTRKASESSMFQSLLKTFNNKLDSVPQGSKGNRSTPNNARSTVSDIGKAFVLPNQFNHPAASASGTGSAKPYNPSGLSTAPSRAPSLNAVYNQSLTAPPAVTPSSSQPQPQNGRPAPRLPLYESTQLPTFPSHLHFQSIPFPDVPPYHNVVEVKFAFTDDIFVPNQRPSLRGYFERVWEGQEKRIWEGWWDEDIVPELNAPYSWQEMEKKFDEDLRRRKEKDQELDGVYADLRKWGDKDRQVGKVKKVSNNNVNISITLVSLVLTSRSQPLQIFADDDADTSTDEAAQLALFVEDDDDDPSDETQPQALFAESDMDIEMGNVDQPSTAPQPLALFADSDMDISMCDLDEPSVAQHLPDVAVPSSESASLNLKEIVRGQKFSLADLLGGFSDDEDEVVEEGVVEGVMEGGSTMLVQSGEEVMGGRSSTVEQSGEGCGLPVGSDEVEEEEVVEQGQVGGLVGVQTHGNAHHEEKIIRAGSAGAVMDGGSGARGDVAVMLGAGDVAIKPEPVEEVDTHQRLAMIDEIVQLPREDDRESLASTVKDEVVFGHGEGAVKIESAEDTGSSERVDSESDVRNIGADSDEPVQVGDVGAREVVEPALVPASSVPVVPVFGDDGDDPQPAPATLLDEVGDAVGVVKGNRGSTPVTTKRKRTSEGRFATPDADTASPSSKRRKDDTPAFVQEDKMLLEIEPEATPETSRTPCGRCNRDWLTTLNPPPNLPADSAVASQVCHTCYNALLQIMKDAGGKKGRGGRQGRRRGVQPVSTQFVCRWGNCGQKRGSQQELEQHFLSAHFAS
ncbi:hypothetical protein HK097_008776 [Rhizophlyctis rosea]|uniref:Uncharacterized protein n=1 Tax=Rhizophlyctis rosea TaxID=64517 RepID=A0AAD5X3R1_9FUNG|nr:hypothetical protein HK097_008776 [Rhizophlyctis rosea]